MFIYVITALAVLAVVCLSAIVAQSARKFDYSEYVVGGDFSVNIKQLAIEMKKVDKVGAVPDVGTLTRTIRRAFKLVRAKAKRGEPLLECEKWIVENCRAVTLNVKRANYRQFATLPHRGEARVVHLASTVVSQTYCDINAEKIASAVHEFCRYTPLTYDEICALKGAFEIALLKKIAYVGKKIISLERARRRAEEDREPDPRYAKKEGYLHYYTALGKRIPEKFLSSYTEIDVENVDFAFAGATADYARLAANAIKSFKSSPEIFTPFFCVSLSPVDRFYSRDDSYRQSDCASKEQYLAATAKLARYFNAGEYTVAKGAFDLAARFNLHFGEIIFDHRYSLRSHVKGRYVAKPKRTSYALDKWAYYLSVFLLQAAFSLVSGFLLPPVWLRITVSALTFVACYPACAYIAERVISYFLPKRPVPRMNNARVPDDAKTAVVVSHYLTDTEQAEKAVSSLLAMQAVNDDDNVCYCLLADFAPSKQKIAEEDDEIIARLNRYASKRNFVILVRSRVKTGRNYGAYERKRGALRDLNECLLSGDTGKFRYVSQKFPFRPRFVITLDEDSRTAPGEIRTAVNTALHPLNAKYDMLAFSSVYSLSSLKTPYSRKFSENAGGQTYCNYDDFYFNLCGRAVFCGKGIYDLEAFHAKTSSVIPDGKVLSHDILEGALTDTGSLNLAVAEDAPDTFVSDAARERRWKRGDVLLLPFATKKYCSDGIYRYVILKNAFSCLAPVAAFVLWILAFTQGYVAMAIPVFFSCFSAIVASLAITTATSSGIRSSEVFFRIAKTVFSALADAALLPFYAFDNACTVIGTFVDYVFNSSALLKWKPFSSLQGKRGFSRHAAVVAPSCVFVVAVAALCYRHPLVAVYAAIFLLVANSLYFAGKSKERAQFSQSGINVLKQYAKDTFSYFEALEKDLLPCDNVQIYPPRGKSATTSPTNVGFALLAQVCAAELGIRSVSDAHESMATLTDTVLRLDKYKGHLYNWYDVSSGKPANPLFVSSADSGNFVAALIVCRRFCKKHNYSETAEKCAKLIDETDFSFLTDKDKKRLYIGYDASKKEYAGEYDLLASESRLAGYVASCGSSDDSLWNGFSRVQTNSKGNVLVSWSGTAFEYLLPQLFLRDVKGSLVTSSVVNAVRTFVSRKCCGLWGISESGYFAFDSDANYQYKAHGVGELALRNEDDLCVITPYASALALKYAPKKALCNLQKLESSGCYGEYGFFEALDFTSGKNTVSSFMTHHQGMILCAVTNALTGGVITEYFMSDEKMRGGALLLEERKIPVVTRKEKKRDFVFGNDDAYRYEVELSEFPTAHLLYGREYGIVIDDYGCGYSRWRDKDVNVFSHSYYKNSGGFGYFVCDGERFCPTFAPLKKDGGAFKATFGRDEVVYENVKRSCSLKIYAPDVLSGEVREYTVTNDSDRSKDYDFVFAERVAMCPREEYAAHPAFCDLFVSARFDEKSNTVYLKRKPRERHGGFSLAATLVSDGEATAECNRQNLFGRNGDESDPCFDFGKTSPSLGDVITPCVGLKRSFTLAPGQSKTLAVVIQCAEDEATLESRVAQVTGTDFLGYACKPAADGAGSALKKYLSDEATARYTDALAAKLLYEPYPKSALLARAQKLFPVGSEEKTVILDYDGNAAFTKKAVKSVIACRLLGINVRLVVIYDPQRFSGEDTAAEICERSTVSDLRSLPFVSFIDKSQCKPNDLKNLIATSFFVLREFRSADKGAVGIAVRRRSGAVAFEDCEKPRLFACGNGGFDQNGDYIVESVPAAPYSNVVCSATGGFVTTENGGGFCYFLNSQANKLSGWSNDQCADPPFERILVSDGQSVIRLNKLNRGGYVRHAKGFTEYVCRTANAEYRLKKSLSAGGRIILSDVTVTVTGSKPLSVGITYLAEPCADSRENRSDVFCEESGDAVRVVNVKTERSFYLYCGEKAELITDCAQAMSRGINGFNPKRVKSPFNNPLCGATVTVNIEAGTSKKISFMLCDGEETLGMARRKEHEFCRENMPAKKSPLSLECPDKSLCILYDNLPYQVLSSRINGRCGYYQAGGAIGFRDQLQDCLALLWSDPDAVRAHILACAERQYIEGDVMHWWHAPAFGVRTKITDDRLFLPYVACEYVEHTGDVTILEEKCDYLVGEPLDGLQEARLEHGRYAGARESLLLHMQRAIDSALVTGEHGLLLIGGGDWNDALNEIGLKGRGESVWLTQFAIETIEKFCPYIDRESAEKYYKVVSKLRNALKNAYFDGRWARAFTDKGEWLGTKRSKGCKTDLICQCWGQITGAGSAEERKSAMQAAKTLVDENCGAIKLFDPPFDASARYGYISSYPRGVRENGGQYTHAAVWYLLACCRAGDAEEANRILGLLNPVKRCIDPIANEKYKGEPYVLAGDVYTNPDNPGRAGWTWYTGSAAWLFKVITEEMLGVKKRGDSLVFSTPVLANAEDAVLTYEYKDTKYRIRFERSDKKGLRIRGVNYTNCSTLALKENCGETQVTVLFTDEPRRP